MSPPTILDVLPFTFRGNVKGGHAFSDHQMLMDLFDAFLEMATMIVTNPKNRKRFPVPLK